MRVLAILGDFYHCSDQQFSLLKSLQVKEHFDLQLVRYPEEVGSLDLEDIDVLLLWRIGKTRPKESDEQWLTPPLERRIEGYVRAGGGLLAIHGGAASHPTDGSFRRLLGGHFTHHPPEHVELTVSPTAAHPVGETPSSFTAPDEHYYVNVDSDLTHIFTIRSTFGESTGGWIKRFGEGRVAVFLPGHTREMLGHEAYRSAVHRLLGWCGGMTKVADFGS